jgi:hypothetical protein
LKPLKAFVQRGKKRSFSPAAAFFALIYAEITIFTQNTTVSQINEGAQNEKNLPYCLNIPLGSTFICPGCGKEN